MTNHKSVSDKVEDLGADINDKVQGLIRDAKPLLHHATDQMSDQVSELAHKGLGAACQGKRDMERAGHNLTGHAASMIRDEPFKAMLIAAGVGAAVVALVGMVSHRPSHHH